MKLHRAFGWVADWLLALRHGGPSVLREILRSPSLLFHPSQLSDLMMYYVWIPFGEGIDQNARKIKESLITPNSRGVVLDLGAGFGHAMKYLDKTKVTTYIALEPNKHMHQHIREMGQALGFTESEGTLVLLSCGVEDLSTYLSSAAPPEIASKFPVDTIMSILAICSFPDTLSQPLTSTLRTLASPKILRPQTGEFLFYEHVLQTERPDVQFWQRFWTKTRIWKIFFGGCRLDVPAHELLRGLGVVEEGRSTATTSGGVGKGNASGNTVWRLGITWGNEGEDPESLFWHQTGRFVAR